MALISAGPRAWAEEGAADAGTEAQPMVDQESQSWRPEAVEGWKTEGGKKWGRGQHGADLRWLASMHRAPRGEGESNHYFDLWERNGLVTFMAHQGLTNNRALVIDSHGTELRSWSGPQYVFRPNSRVLPAGAAAPAYSVRDFARVLGPTAAARIHNVVIAGCNQEGVLKPAEFRRYFPNATNITYMAGGNLAYKPSFYQALSRHSLDIEPLYGRATTNANGNLRVEVSRQPGLGSMLLGNYVSDLFEPGTIRPYRQQRTGRELLDPGFAPKAAPVSSLGATALPTATEAARPQP